MVDTLTYYQAAGEMTDPREFRYLFEGLPSAIGALVKVVQGLMVHVYWTERMGLSLAEERRQEVQIRPVSAKLARLLELDPRPLTEARPPERRLVGNCRDFTVLLAAMLKYHGLAARARCGFGAYFMPNHYEDHWVCEYWNAAQQRWLLVDAQLDEFQQRVLGIRFDVLNVPRQQFITGGQAWLMCRAGQADPNSFGIFDMKGLAFVLGDMIRDLLALNRLEILPWDSWRMMVGLDEQPAPESLPTLDRLARLTLDPDAHAAALRAAFRELSVA